MRAALMQLWCEDAALACWVRLLFRIRTRDVECEVQRPLLEIE
ncbi:hypothetical protein Tco_0571897, partial [Tanacetum coccineum]